jgi:hypothetical protein
MGTTLNQLSILWEVVQNLSAIFPNLSNVWDIYFLRK